MGEHLVRGGAVVVVVAALGCGDARERPDATGGGSIASLGSLSATAGDDGDGDDDGSTASDESDDDGGSGGSTFDLGDGAGEASDPEDCSSVVEMTDVGKAGADIIIVIDNSQSMGNEIAQVQAQMNAFSAQIVAADVDPHVVMVSGFEHNSDSGICVPPPLGSGMCPAADHNPPMYWRVGDWVGSHSSLSRVVSTYDQYGATMRDDAATHVVVVSDDDSDWTPEQFTQEFVAKNPKLAGFVLHAIVAGNGNVYEALVSQTGGILGNLGANEFQPIFDELAATVVEQASLACAFDIPPPPDGQIFDPTEVNVEFADGAGGVLEIGYVDSVAQCAGVENAWYYDNAAAPTQILLCEQTCDAIQGFALATIGIEFGCATIPAG